MQPTLGAGKAFIGAFGPLHVINLAHRNDRRRDFAGQLNRIGLALSHPSVRVHRAARPDAPGGFPSIGARGCFLSHLELLCAARDEGLESLIVCEDDLDFAYDFNARLPNILADIISGDWGLCYAGHLTLPLDLVNPISAVPSYEGVTGMHFFIVRRHFFLPLIPYLEAILSRAPGHPDGGPMHVDGAISHFRADHPELTTIAVTPPLGHQRPSRTDIHALRFYDRMPILRGMSSLLRSFLRELQINKQN